VCLAALAVAVASTNLAAAKDAEAPPAKKPYVVITISKETTYITEPLRKDGYVDYVAALNELFRAGVTPGNNAAVPLLKAMGPGKISAKCRDEYCRMLGIAPLPEKGEYFVDLYEYVKRSGDAKNAGDLPGVIARKVTCEQEFQAMKRPWSKKEFPILAGWLAANEEPLSLVVKASKRRRRYDPLVSEDGSLEGTLSCILSLTQYREVEDALLARAMLRVGEYKVVEAWDDLLACHRWARLVGRGPTLIEALVANAYDAKACAADQGLLQQERLTAAQIAGMRRDLDKLPPLPNGADKIKIGERFFLLDSIGRVARHEVSALDMTYEFGYDRKPSMLKSLIDSTVMATVDWNKVLRVGNSWLDRMANAFDKPRGAERRAALRKLDDDINKLPAAAKDWKSLGLSVLNGEKNSITERTGQIIMCAGQPWFSAYARGEDRAAMQFDLIKLAFALAAYRADNGSYPAKLAELVPKYVAEVPKDIFNDSDLHYRQEGDGYLLYSVGVNGKDDGGRTYDDCKNGENWDDLVVHIHRE
jgi:hypothetical protein